MTATAPRIKNVHHGRGESAHTTKELAQGAHQLFPASAAMLINTQNSERMFKPKALETACGVAEYLHEVAT